MIKGKLDTNNRIVVTDAGGTAGVLDTANDLASADVSDIDHVSIMVNQLTDNGTCTIVVSKTLDGVNWATVATLHETDFPTGANTAKEVTLSDAAGMPTRAKAIKAQLTVVSGGGVYGAFVAGAAVGHTT